MSNETVKKPTVAVVDKAAIEKIKAAKEKALLNGKIILK